MEILLAIATLLGGATALWFFWDKITAWWQSRKLKEVLDPLNLAANPTRENIERVILESNPVDDWNHHSDAKRSIASYKRDLNLRFEIEYTDEGVQRENFKEPWANRHPDPSATGYWCNMYYGATLVKRYILVSVDGGRVMLPIPKKGAKNVRPNQVLPFEYKVAQIHDTLRALDEYMKRSGLSIYAGKLDSEPN